MEFKGGFVFHHLPLSPIGCISYCYRRKKVNIIVSFMLLAILKSSEMSRDTTFIYPSFMLNMDMEPEDVPIRNNVFLRFKQAHET